VYKPCSKAALCKTLINTQAETVSTSYARHNVCLLGYRNKQDVPSPGRGTKPLSVGPTQTAHYS